jgi:predicted small lipoprotein YifL
MKRLILALAVLAGLSLANCTERSPYGSNPDAKSNNNNATPATQDTMARDNTGTMQNGGTSPNGSSSTGGGTGNGGQ